MRFQKITLRTTKKTVQLSILCNSSNVVLFNQATSIGKNLDSRIYGKPRINLFSYFFDLRKIKLVKSQHILVYNTSPTNFLTSFISKFFGSKIIFHIHDPKPHSGKLNFVIWIIQVFQILISEQILVFDQRLIEDVKKYYPFTRKKHCLRVTHGTPEFNLITTMLDKQKINFGFFGRNMPYKNVFEFIHLSKKFPQCNFSIYGAGYDNQKQQKNLFINNEYISNNEYYSAMVEMDYVVVPYTNISYSGVISDALSLNKKIITSNFVEKKLANHNFINIKNFNFPKKQTQSTISKNYGWRKYAKELNHILS